MITVAKKLTMSLSLLTFSLIIVPVKAMESGEKVVRRETDRSVSYRLGNLTCDYNKAYKSFSCPYAERNPYTGAVKIKQKPAPEKLFRSLEKKFQKQGK